MTPPSPSGSARNPSAVATARMMIQIGFVSLPAATKAPDFWVSASMSAQTSTPNARTVRSEQDEVLDRVDAFGEHASRVRSPRR